MPVVRSIEQRRGGTALVSVDDADPVELPLEALLEHNLHENRALEPDRWARIVAEGRHRVAVRRGLEFLAKRRRTRAALEEHLAADYPPEAVERALARIDELGYLDDGAWARSYVAQPRSRGRGRSALARELRDKGIGPVDLEDALDGHDDRAEALIAARKRVRALRRLEPDIRERRLYAYLRRRGFGDAVVRDAMSAVLEAETSATASAPAPSTP
jgi:regulatory protein